MFDINGAEFLVLLVIVLVVVGPERLPEYAAQLGRLVRHLRKLAMGAKEQVRAELGPEFDDVDWAKLDPRQYDPRRIVREALTEAWEDEPVKPVSTSKSSEARPDLTKTATRPRFEGRAPFDTEAT